MQDATGNEWKRRQVTASFQGINEENTEKFYSAACLWQIISLFTPIYMYIYIYMFLGHSVFVACHQEGLYKQIPLPTYYALLYISTYLLCIQTCAIYTYIYIYIYIYIHIYI